MISSLKGDRSVKYIYNIEKTKDYTKKMNFEEKIGKKAQNLLELAVQGFNVPKFSVVTNKYFREVILNEIKKEYKRKEKNEDEINEKEGVDFFDEVQLLDIDTKRSDKTYTTAGGSYYLPQYISDLDRAAIRIRHYFGVDEDSGQAFIKDYRLVSFESAKKRDYSKDLKGEK